MKYLKSFESNIDINKQLIELIENNMLNGSAEVINNIISLINNGADPNIRTDLGFTTLSYAASINNSEFVKYLLGKSADPNPNSDINEETPISWACTTGSVSSVFVLLAAGAKLFCRFLKMNKYVYSLDFLSQNDIELIEKKYPEQYEEYMKEFNFYNDVNKYNL